MPLDYSEEAARYDETRGGLPRARAAAEAIINLTSPREPPFDSGGRVAWTLLDVAGGTGIVSGELAALGFRVAVADLVPEMLRHAHDRLPGAAVATDATRLPVADGRLDVVTMVWLLHLVPDAEPIIGEAARVLRPGGLLVTTVDKAVANHRAIDPRSATPRAGTSTRAKGRPVTDARSLVTTHAARHGLDPAGETTFVGLGQRGEPIYTLVAYRKRSI
ncbi:class I SAM-dependent methyltransferase [Knoellia sp. Soil729]|uniref:class I SAM-dependent methyltransferase n=1 Tax=Knoellia sp. Soil729 TaxID=1736394 RepID=UPI0006F3D943|nr:class I SAM-dependent methyltransferase [Knoellia sp. Soil729]KRE44145.1 hypothetical protein ASG74_04855 [Knoellia sp. Soil729]